MVSEQKKGVEVPVKSRLCEIPLRFINTNGLQIAPPIVLHSYIIRSSPTALFSILLFNIQTTYLSLLSIFPVPLVYRCARNFESYLLMFLLNPNISRQRRELPLIFFIDTAVGPSCSPIDSFFITYRRWIYRG